MTPLADSREEAWPSLPLESWSGTCATLAYVDSDRRQDSPCPKSLGQSLLACHALRDFQRAHDFAHSVSSPGRSKSSSISSIINWLSRPATGVPELFPWSHNRWRHFTGA